MNNNFEGFNKELTSGAKAAEGIGKVIKIRNHFDSLSKLEQKEALTYLKSYAKSLPVFLCLNLERTALVKVSQPLSGKKAKAMGFKLDSQGLPFKPKQIYIIAMPIETRPFEMVLAAFKRGGLEEVEKASIKYMADFEICQKIVKPTPVVEGDFANDGL